MQWHAPARTVGCLSPPKRSCPSAPTASTVWIDDNVYPHITDNILRWATWSTLCVFRRTSKSLIARVDTLMGEHIVLGCDTPPRMNITSPYGRIPGMRDRHYSDWSKPGKKRAKWELERSKKLLGHTRVVDIIGIGDISLVPIAKSLTEVRVLRVRPDHDNAQVYKSHFTAPKMVVFGDVGAPEIVLGDWRTVVPDTVDKLVVNIRYHPAQQGEVRFPIIVELFPPTVREVVVHITEPRWINALPPWDRERFQRARWNSISSSLAGMLQRTRRPEFKITIVGFRSLYPGWLGQQFESVTQLEPELLRSVEDSLRQNLPTHVTEAEEDGEGKEKSPFTEDPDAWPFPDVRTALRRITFTTREAYTETLDRDEHLLETAEVLESDTRGPPLKEKWPTRGIAGFIGM